MYGGAASLDLRNNEPSGIAATLAMPARSASPIGGTVEDMMNPRARFP